MCPGNGINVSAVTGEKGINWIKLIKVLKEMGLTICQVLPILEAISQKTSTKIDDKIVEVLKIFC